MKQCPICNAEFKECFRGMILQRYDVAYYQCEQCRFLQTETPYWLAEAYARVLNLEDTGLVQRNIRFSELTAIMIYSSFKKDGIFVDYAGGCGLFTRLMRDIGFEFYWYDPYAQNILSCGLEFNKQLHQPVELVTLFEALEHFVEPIAEFEKMLQISPTIIFSTQFLPFPTPDLNQWWYYGSDHGQHVSFYSRETCQWIAKKLGLHFYSFHELHMFSKEPINGTWVNLLLRASNWGVLRYIKSQLISKTESDYLHFRQRTVRNR